MKGTPGKTLLLFRHAKSSWKDSDLPDIERPLNKRGKKDAPEMGRRLAERGIHPDVIITSPARRAQETAKAAAKSIGFADKDVLVKNRIYMAGAKGLLKTIWDLDDGWNMVVLIGHNPDLTELGNQLGGLDIANIPTSGMLALKFQVARWNEVKPGSGQQIFFDFPKNDPEKKS